MPSYKRLAIVCDFLDEFLQDGVRLEYRQMFGVYGIFINKTIIALILDNKIYLKGVGLTKLKYIDRGWSNFIQPNRWVAELPDYYEVPLRIDERVDDLKFFVHEAIEAVSIQVMKEKVRNISELANMNSKLTRLLFKVGIETSEQFVSLGAAKAYVSILSLSKPNIPLSTLWKFQGAILGCYWSLLTNEQRMVLVNEALSCVNYVGNASLYTYIKRESLVLH